jgi:hypothetical protein
MPITIKMKMLASKSPFMSENENFTYIWSILTQGRHNHKMNNKQYFGIGSNTSYNNTMSRISSKTRGI